jgi:hypothetical protein
VLIEEILAICDVATVRATTDGTVGPEMTMLLSLVIFDGYEIGGRSEGHSLPLPRGREPGV